MGGGGSSHKEALAVALPESPDFSYPKASFSSTTCFSLSLSSPSPSQFLSLPQGEDGFPGFKGDGGPKGDRVRPAPS